MIELSRSVTKKLHRSLLPYEDDIYKLEDIVLFLNPRSSFIFFISINLLFFIIYIFHTSVYSIFFVVLGFHFAFIFTNFKKVYSLFLEKKIYEIEPERKIKRFNIAQISALIGTIVYVVIYLLKKTFNSTIECNLTIILIVLLVLIIFFRFFLSISDLIFCCFTLNLVLLLPFLLQSKTTQLIDLLQKKICCAISAEEENKDHNNDYEYNLINYNAHKSLIEDECINKNMACFDNKIEYCNKEEENSSNNKEEQEVENNSNNKEEQEVENSSNNKEEEELENISNNKEEQEVENSSNAMDTPNEI